jgi:hypothetical protein
LQKSCFKADKSKDGYESILNKFFAASFLGDQPGFTVQPALLNDLPGRDGKIVIC